ncbi:MAG TPA: hypothetical protein VFQ61_17325, partial [Polyangiaceae bacterium]|nr:hypothetical protein [Polyangiaceae bacterium]
MRRRLEPCDRTEVRRRFVRGRVEPRGVVWFGLRSFWGHLRHFLASGIATEDIDSRHWMTPDDPTQLVQRVAEILGGKPNATNLLESLDRDLFIDYVSDTGDDVSVSQALANLLVAEYDLPDPRCPTERIEAPRGELLLFGGDTAYPVATALEITNRIIVPFNRAIEAQPDDKPRVLLGIPGNHDWYDGLDGFGRLFRRRDEEPTDSRPTLFGISPRMLQHYTEWARELVRGGKVEKPRALVLSGYTPVQDASYFVLPLTPDIHLFAADRQLKQIDPRQRRFMREWYGNHPEVAPWVLLPDPLYAFGRPSPTGTRTVESLGLDFGARDHFLLSGDVHHYERSKEDRLLHVTAGGGGAFLHPAPMFEGRLRADVRWPNATQSRALLRQVPWKVARGRSGFLPHLSLAALYGLALAASTAYDEQPALLPLSSAALCLIVTLVYRAIGGLRNAARRVLPLAFGAGLLTACIPQVLAFGLERAALGSHVMLSRWVIGLLSLLAAAFV